MPIDPTVLQEGTLIAYLLVFMGGILTSISPCNVAMIPLIIGYVGGSQQLSRQRCFVLSLTFAIGLAITFMLLGVFAALIGGMFGGTSRVWFYIVAGVCVLIGLNMLGLIPLPELYWLSDLRSRIALKGIGGALALGLVSGLIASQCATPVIAAILTYVMAAQNTIVRLWRNADVCVCPGARSTDCGRRHLHRCAQKPALIWRVVNASPTRQRYLDYWRGHVFPVGGVEAPAWVPLRPAMPAMLAMPALRATPVVAPTIDGGRWAAMGAILRNALHRRIAYRRAWCATMVGNARPLVLTPGRKAAKAQSEGKGSSSVIAWYSTIMWRLTPHNQNLCIASAPPRLTYPRLRASPHPRILPIALAVVCRNGYNVPECLVTF